MNQSVWVLSFIYFVCYIFTGVLVKLFTGSIEQGFFGLNGIEYLVYSTLFCNFFCMSVVIGLGWFKRGSLTRTEKWTLFVSGVCTAYIIPASTLVYSLPISIMVAMVLMRGSVIVASRMVDFLLGLQGLKKKRISWQEELAVVFAIAAILSKVIFGHAGNSQVPVEGAVVLTVYFLAYLVRIYIMNRSKLLGVGGKNLDSKLYFAWEQFFSFAVLVVVVSGILFYSNTPQLNALEPHSIIASAVLAFKNPHFLWGWAAVSGLPYAIIAFVSVFLFLFPNKTATFTGVLNRSVSLMGGTVSSIVLALLWGGSWPPLEDWVSLGFISAAILLLAWGDRATSSDAG